MHSKNQHDIQNDYPREALMEVPLIFNGLHYLTSIDH